MRCEIWERLGRDVQGGGEKREEGRGRRVRRKRMKLEIACMGIGEEMKMNEK